MSRNGRIGLLALAAVIAVVVFVLARPEEGSERADDPSTDVGQTAPAPGTDGSRGKDVGPTATAESAPPPPRTITVRAGEPVGGEQEISVKAGERVALEVRSRDTSDEVHIHGYDLSKELAPGRPVGFSFLAELEGVFEIELEGAGVPIASLTVEPSGCPVLWTAYPSGGVLR